MVRRDFITLIPVLLFWIRELSCSVQSNLLSNMSPRNFALLEAYMFVELSVMWQFDVSICRRVKITSFVFAIERERPRVLRYLSILFRLVCKTRKQCSRSLEVQYKVTSSANFIQWQPSVGSSFVRSSIFPVPTLYRVGQEAHPCGRPFRES